MKPRKNQLVHGKSQIYLYGVGHIKSALSIYFQVVKSSLFRCGNGIDALSDVNNKVDHIMEIGKI